MRGSRSRDIFFNQGGMSILVAESTLSLAGRGLCRERLSEAALRRDMREHISPGKQIDDRKPLGLLVSSVH
jgi:hypothetical protein